MYVLMEHRSPERRPPARSVHSVERHRQPLLRGRAVVHSSHPSSPHPAAIRCRYSITPQMSSSATSALLLGIEEKRRKTSSGQQPQQLRRRQFVRQNGMMATDNEQNDDANNRGKTAEEHHQPNFPTE
ncbi:hypothetical protein niasHT_017884 [Heterodera trifolii]|uniref:Uncharacterized protein n=1 Tax=Heterodera trifolii TaxID=157864 RepID=A0ABD2LHT9_9BILA